MRFVKFVNEEMFRELFIYEKRLRIYGTIHSPFDRAARNCLALYESLMIEEKNPPDLFLVETNRKSLELSQFVFANHDNETKFCLEESMFNETAAIAACSKLGIMHQNRIIPIDVESEKTRRKLARFALFHPWEALVLISQYHGNAPKTIESIEYANEWRSEIKSRCPNAFNILFTDREKYMSGKILHTISSSSDYYSFSRNIAVITGLSHVEAIVSELIDRR